MILFYDIPDFTVYKNAKLERYENQDPFKKYVSEKIPLSYCHTLNLRAENSRKLARFIIEARIRYLEDLFFAKNRKLLALWGQKGKIFLTFPKDV